MNELCNRRVRDCIEPLTGQRLTGDPDLPLRNLSSEDPDGPFYPGFKGTNDSGTPDDPTGGNYTKQGCLSVCVGSSQAEVDACLARQQSICDLTKNPKDPYPVFDPDPWTPPPPGFPPPGTPGGNNGGPPGNNPSTHGGGNPVPDGGGGDPTPPDPTPGGGGPPYASNAQSCTLTCPDGSTFTKTVPAGDIVAKTQALADEMAKKKACQLATDAKICLSAMDPKQICLWGDYNGTAGVGSVFVTGAHAPYEITAAGLPPGITGTVNDNGTQIKFAGTPTGAGSYEFTVTARDNLGNSNFRKYKIDVAGISLAPGSVMPEGLYQDPYAYNFTAQGPFTSPAVFHMSGLPAGLTYTSLGEVSGTPTAYGDFQVGVTVRDANGWTCSGLYFLHIVKCGVDKFEGEWATHFDCAGGSLANIAATLLIPNRKCDRHITIEAEVTDCLLSDCALFTAGMQVEVWNGETQISSNFIATINPFAHTLSTGFDVPAKTDSYRVVVRVSGVAPDHNNCKNVSRIRVSGL